MSDCDEGDDDGQDQLRGGNANRLSRLVFKDRRKGCRRVGKTGIASKRSSLLVQHSFTHQVGGFLLTG